MKFLITIALCILGSHGASAQEAGGSIYFNGPTEYNYNTFYYANNLQIASTNPCFGCSSSSITSVYWQLSYSNQLPGQHAFLCATNVSCLDISNQLTQGGTNVFNGLKNNTVFFIRYYVTSGSGCDSASFSHDRV